jgi:hypothetical protein
MFKKDHSVRQVIATQDRTFAAIAGRVRQVCFVACCLSLTSLSATVWGQDEAGQSRPSGSSQSPSVSTAQSTPKPASAGQANKVNPGQADASDSKSLLQLQQKLEKRRDEVMQIRKPLLEAGAEDSYNRIKFKSMLRSGIDSAADRKIFNASLRYRVLQMADAEAYRNAAALRFKLLRDLNTCGSKVQGAVAKRKFRQETMAKVVGHCESMFDNQLIVRINAIRLISYLDIESGASSRLPVPYLDSYVSLLKVVNDPTQLPSVKLSAVRGLQRILQLGSVAGTIQDTIADDLIKIAVIGNPAFPWLDETICRTIAEVKTAKETRVQALLTIMADGKRAWRVRSAVAFALGRTGWNPKMADLLAYRVTQLLHQISASYNRNPYNSLMTTFAFDTYLAYHHDKGENKDEKIGLLKRQPTGNVKQSFEKVVVPTLNHMLNAPGKKIPAAIMDTTAAWLQENAQINTVDTPR